MAGIANTGALKGKTLFITGASRGIGLAIALKAAHDGANIVVAAKTADPHKKLPGTIYTAADEIEAAGGKALPVVADIRMDDMVESAVEHAVKRFGGIDILVNNASAISITGTLETTMKKYDLMNSINTRGTFLTSKLCLPHLLKGSNPHILTISPPLDLNPAWFKPHAAYTIAKYGMSMCVLGMAAEFKGKVAVNALWPRTAIYTAATEMLGGGPSIASQCRKPDIVADSAYSILTRPITYTGNFAIDEEVVREVGVKDLDSYAVDPTQPLLTDFFLSDIKRGGSIKDRLDQPKGAEALGFAVSYFDSLKSRLSADMVKKIGSDFIFDILGVGQWYVDLKTGSGEVCQRATPTADVTVVLTEQQLADISEKKEKPHVLFMKGEIKVEGNLMKAMLLSHVLTK